MAGQHRPLVKIHRLVEALIRQVGHVEDHADARHLFQQRRALREEPALGAGAVRVGADAVVGRADDAQAGVPPLLHLLGMQHWVGPLHAEDETQRLAIAVPFCPRRKVRIKGGGILDPAQHALLFQRPVIVQLPHRRAVGGYHRVVALEGGHHPGTMQSGQQRGDKQTDPAATEVVERDGAHSPALAVEIRLDLVAANVGDGELEVAVPVDRVPGEIEVGVEDQRKGLVGHDGSCGIRRAGDDSPRARTGTFFPGSP